MTSTMVKEVSWWSIDHDVYFSVGATAGDTGDTGDDNDDDEIVGI